MVDIIKTVQGWFGGTRATLRDPSALADLVPAKTAAGVSVDRAKALTFSGVYGAVRIISETVAGLPRHVYRRDGDNAIKESGHPLADLLHEPNQTQTEFSLFETLMGYVLTWGNAYCEITRAPMTGRVVGLHIMRPDRVTPRVRGGRLEYDIRTDNNGTVVLPADKVLHIKAVGDGIAGYSQIRLAREAIGLGLAAEQHGAKFFGNDATPGGVLAHPGRIKKETADRLRSSWERLHGGASNSHKVAILEEGMAWQSIGLPNSDSQWLESRKFSISEVARIYSVPLHMLGDLERATFSNIEHQGIEFSKFSILPWCIRIEQEINRKLLPDAERGLFYVRHNLDGLQRGDAAIRSSFYNTMFQIGALSQNDIRALEEQNPIENGDVYFVPLNLRPSDEEPEPEPAPVPDPPAAEPEPEPGDESMRAAMRDLLADGLRRVLSHEAVRARKAARDPSSFIDWLDEFYGSTAQLATYLRTSINVCEAAGYEVNDLVRDHFQRSQAELLEVAGTSTATTLEANVDQVVEQWQHTRPHQAACTVI